MSDPRAAGVEDRDWQRLDTWLWCARFLRARSACAKLVQGGLLRLNRQPTDKAHARLRVGDVLTVPLGREVRVVEVLALARRRGPAAEAQGLYRVIAAPDGDAAVQRVSCGEGETAAYRAPERLAPSCTRSAD
ncbi:MAG: RNA-binding S4 domain-containing protein [Rhodospirillales bacterium]|nr:RNA-binding S4 domain-containing protein [Rhodospirillales bacterium]